MKNKHFLVRCLLVPALAGLALVANAQSNGPDVPPPSEVRRDLAPPRNPVSLSDSVRRAQRETGGQILGAERVQYDGREINRVKVMDDRGRVRYMDDDPQRSRDSSDRPRNLLPREEAQPRPRGERPRRP